MILRLKPLSSSLRLPALAIAGVVAIGAPHKSVEAFLPKIDPTLAAEMIASNMMMMSQWLEDSIRSEIAMAGETAMASAHVDAANQRELNRMVRDGKRDEDRSRIELLLEMVPDMNACNDMNVSTSLTDSACEIEREVAEEVNRYTERHTSFNHTPTEYQEQATQIAQETLDLCRSLSEDGESIAQCARADKLISGGEARVFYTDQDREATRLQIDIIAGVIPEMHTDPRMGNSPGANASRIEDLRRVAFRSLVSQSLHEIRAERIAPDSPSGEGKIESPMEVISNFVYERFGSADAQDFLKAISNTGEANGVNWGVDMASGSMTESERRAWDSLQATSHTTTIGQVQRKQAVMDAFQNYLLYRMWQGNLRREALQAAMLALEIEPLRE